MPDQERKYGTRITTAGSTLITNCILAGTKLKITQAAAGDGGGSYYLPSTEQTELVRELWRGPIVSAEQNASVPNMLDVKIIIDDSVGNFIVREMGLFDEDGTLIAICNTPDTEKVAISTGVDGRLTMLMHIVVVDSSVLEFTITPSLDTVSPEDLEEERRLAYVGITRAKKELYISHSVTRMLYGRTCRNEPSRVLNEIEPEYLETTRSPSLDRPARSWGSMGDGVPGGASGYSGPSGWGRTASGSRSSGYLNREYNAGAGRAKVAFPGAPAAGISRPAAPRPSAPSKHYEPGETVFHKVFGRGMVTRVTPAAGDSIVEIRFEKVGTKKMMANLAPLTKGTED